MPPPDSIKIEERIVDRIHYHADSPELAPLGNKTDVGPSPLKLNQNVNQTLTIPSKKLACLSFGVGSVEAVIDSGSEVTVCHPDVVPSQLITEADDSGECGRVQLRGAFREELVAKTYHIPCWLLEGSERVACTPEIQLYCAVTPKLLVDRVLLSAEDYATLER